MEATTTLDPDHFDCNLFPVDYVKPEDDSYPTDMFFFEVKAAFMPPLYLMDDESDIDQLYDAECDIKQANFSVERDKLLGGPEEETSRSAIQDILLRMGVPVMSFLIDKILNDVCEMGNNAYNMGRRVLRMRVVIHVPPLLPFETPDPDDANVVNGDIDGEIVDFVAATKSSIESLETVKVEASKVEKCTICLEELMTGLEATRLPCYHLYHGQCIRNWLENNRVCPLCRLEIIG